MHLTRCVLNQQPTYSSFCTQQEDQPPNFTTFLNQSRSFNSSPAEKLQIYVGKQKSDPHTVHSLNDELKVLPLPPKCLTMWFYLQFALEVLQNGGGYEPTHSTSINTENGEPFASVPLGLLSRVLDRHFANSD